jgi:hypothetical protein
MFGLIRGSGMKNEDGFVKSPSAALRFNFAPLDNKPVFGIQGNLPDIGGRTSLLKSI